MLSVDPYPLTLALHPGLSRDEGAEGVLGEAE
jgi:hypothetical protein